MNAIIAITRREIADKKFVLIAAVAFGFLPFLLQALPGSHVGRLGVVTMSTIFAAGFAGGLAMILGATFIGGDISNGRMSFYFSRPIAAPAIWFGKLTAAVVILLATFFIIFAPGLLFSSNGSVAWSQAFPTELGATVATALACCLALLLLAHVVGTFVRSRSAWIAIDFAIAVILGVASFAMLRPLFLGQATELFTWLLGALLIGITVSIIGAGAFQLARGRTDRVRSHLALSQSLWSALLVVVALAGAFVWWVMSATPGDITKRGLAEQSPSGNLMILSGLVRGRADYHAVFLMDPVSGAFERIRPANFYSAEFVAGGTKLVEVERASVADGVADVYLRDAVPNGPRFDPHITVTARGDWRIAVSDDARQMAVADQGNLTVYDISSRRALGSVQIDPALGRMDSMYFAARDVVRMDFVLDQEKIPQTHDRTISIVEFDTAQRKLTRTGGVQTTGRFVRLGVSPDGSRMVLRTDHSLSIHDARTGALVSSPLLSPSELGYATTFLHDGGVAVAIRSEQRSEIRVFNVDGTVRRSIPIGPSGRVWPIREIAPDRLVAGFSQGGGTSNRWESLSVDLTTGQVLRRQPGLQPAFDDGLMRWSRHDPRVDRISPLELYNEGTALVRWNALTGEKTTIVRGGE